MILRPAVKAESPAKWYVEDGSGRAVCFFRRLIAHKLAALKRAFTEEAMAPGQTTGALGVT